VELRRDAIERGDFPRVSDGYDPKAVAEHLRDLADAVEVALASGKAGEGGQSNAERVRAIVDSAERSLAELAQSAREDAEGLRAEARAYRDRARQAAAAVEERAAALARELDELPDDGRSDAAHPAGDEPEAATEAGPDAAPLAAEPTGGARAEGSSGGEAPRVIALNMALDGSSRDEIAHYLQENFELDDPEEIVSEVWSRARG
jgi:hypothetical protein